MRIIQSMWTANQSVLLNNSFGWLSPEYHLMSWALSCLQLKQFYPKVILYSDTAASRMLIDNLKLPYDELVCNLDTLNHYDSKLWAVPKMKAYSLQESPFLHVDGDVFVWKKFDDSLLNSPLIAQNKDELTSFTEYIQKLEANFSYFPNEIIEDRNLNHNVQTYNAGIYGGSDIDFFKEYTSKAFDFINKNKLHFKNTDITEINVIFEQYLFYCMAKSKNKKVSVLFPETYKKDEYKGFGDFDKIPFEKQFIHLLSDYKKSEAKCNQMAQRLRLDYPEYYYKIISLFKKNKIPMLKEYYFFETQKDSYLKNHLDLKESFGKRNLEIFIPESYIKNKIEIKTLLWNLPLNNLSNEQWKDLVLFVEEINLILVKEYSTISNDYLYARDIHLPSFNSILFENKNEVYNKRIAVANSYKIIRSQFNWCSFFEKNATSDLNLNDPPSRTASEIISVMIPECDTLGFSINAIDELELTILQLIGTGITLNELFNELKCYFDEEDLKDSSAEFEQLIFKKINNGFLNKSIQLII